MNFLNGLINEAKKKKQQFEAAASGTVHNVSNVAQNVGHTVQADVVHPAQNVVHTVVQAPQTFHAPTLPSFAAPKIPSFNVAQSTRPTMPSAPRNPLTNIAAIRPQPQPNLLQKLNNGLHTVENTASKVYDQGNMLDNGRSFKQRTPTNNRSVTGQLTHNGATNVAGNMAGKPIMRAANTVAVVPAAVAGISRAASHPQQFKQIIGDTNRQVDSLLTHGLGNVGGYMTPQQAASSGGGAQSLKQNFIKPTVRAAAEVAPLAIPGGGLAKGANLGMRTLADVGYNAGVGAATNTAQQLVDTGKINAKQLAGATAMSAALPAIAPIAKAAAPVIAKAGAEGSKAAAWKAATADIKKPTNLSNAHLNAMTKVMDAHDGKTSPFDISDRENRLFNDAQKKLGAKPGTPEGIMAVDQALKVHNAYDTKLIQRDALLNTVKDRVSQFNADHPIGLTVGGEGAGRFQQALKKGEVWGGIDGKPRFEINDQHARLVSIGDAKGKLGNVLRHDVLYENYPQLKDIPVDIKIGKEFAKAEGGVTDPVTGEMQIYATNHARAKKELLHEVQHNLQRIEGRQMGTSPEEAGSYQHYYNNAAEAEARAVAERRNLSDGERYVQGKPLGKDETVLYHRTSKENAAKIMQSGKLLSKENTGEVFLSNHKDGQNAGYGDTVVPVRVKKSDIRLDDEFPSGEQHFAVKADKVTPHTEFAPRSTFNDTLYKDVPKDQQIVKGASDGVVKSNIPEELKPLAEEAKKYGSAEEFAKAQRKKVYTTDTVDIDPERAAFLKSRGYEVIKNWASGESIALDDIASGKVSTSQGYAMTHRPNEDGARAHNLTESEEVPKDMYQNWYGSRGTETDKESIAALQAIKGKPNAEVTIYRASPNPKFNSGDWVTFSKKYAEQHAESNGGGKMQVFSQKVKAKDVRWAQDDINEFGYYPEGVKQAKPEKRIATNAILDDNQKLKDLYNQVHGKNSGPMMSIDKRAHADDLSPEQNQFIAQYAEMLKDQGNGVAIHPDGRRLTNNNRAASLGSGNITNTQWFDQARADLESGKGAYGASDEYKALSSEQAPLDVPAGFEAPTPKPKAAPKATLPTHVKSAALAKVEKLPTGSKKVETVNNKEPLPEYNTKKVSGIDKAFRSTRSIIERQGEHGKQLAGMLQKARDTEEIYQGQIAKQIPTVRSLKGKAFENFVEATQGKAKPVNSKVEQAIKEWQAVHPGIRDRAVKAGLDVGDLGPEYYPHFIDYDKIFKDKNTYNAAINHLVETGQATSHEEAIKLLNYAKDVSRNRVFGNLEASRQVDLPFYDKTPNSLTSYLSSASKRIAQTETFGAKDEKALKLIDKAGMQGYDTEAMKNAYDVAVGAKRYGQTATNISNKLRSYQSTTRLGLGAITNATQNVNTGIVTGHLRTLGAMVKQLDPKTRSYVEDTGAISDAVLNDLKTQAGFVGKSLGKITAPGFASVEKFNRSVAATAGRDYALRLAQKGDEGTLRKLGVTGEIKNKTLTHSQQVQASRKVVEKTQFKVDAQDLPGWADSPGGKLVSQFRTFSYAQGKFFSNEILKPAAKGNMMPLGRLLAALPVGYAVYEGKRAIAGRPEEDNKARRGLEAFGNVGGAGLAVDLFRGLVPLNGKYLTPDRFTSMAAGTLGGPTLGGAVDLAGGVVQAVQKKNLPKSRDDLKGKAAIVAGDGYYDPTTLARFGLRQIPVAGTAIQNRVLPYQQKSGLHKDQQAFYDQITDPAKKEAYKQSMLDANNADNKAQKQKTINSFYGKSSSGTTTSIKEQAKTAKQPQKGIYTVIGKDGKQKYATLQGSDLKNYSNLDDAKTAQAKNIFKYSKNKVVTINGEQYHKSDSGKVVKGAPPMPKVATTPTTTYDAKTNTWTKMTPTTGKIVRVDKNGVETVVNPGTGSISNARPDYVTNINKLASKYKIDRNAVMAVAAAEGLGGGVGDNGTSFGPFQLHAGGKLPAGKTQAWAESPEGIDYALQQIESVSKGLTGQAAIDAIVRKFEIPADPNNEVARALAIYSGKSVKLASGEARSAKISGIDTKSSSKKNKTTGLSPSDFKLPTDLVSSKTKGAQLARAAGLSGSKKLTARTVSYRKPALLSNTLKKKA